MDRLRPLVQNFPSTSIRCGNRILFRSEERHTTTATLVYFHPVVGIDVTITRECAGKSKSLVARTHDCRQLHRLSSVAFTQAGCAGSLDFLDRRPAPGSYHPCGCLCGQWDIDRSDEDSCRSLARGEGLVEVFRTLNDQSFPSGHVMSFVAFWGMVFSFGIIFFDWLSSRKLRGATDIV